MSLSRMIRWMGLALVFAAFAGVIPARAQTGGIEGKVTLQDGTLCAGCPVLIERQEIKGTYKTKTDKHGKYIYIGLPIGTYKVTLQDPNGRVLFFFGGKHLGLGEPTEVDFDLAKEMAIAKKEQESNPEVQKQREQQAKEKKEFTGLKGVFDEGAALMAAAQGLQAGPSDPLEKRQQIEQERLQKYAQAAEKFEQALPLAKGKDQLVVLERLADTYAKARQRDKAIATYQQAIAASPTNASLHNNLGNVYADSGQIDKAKEEFQKAAELDPAGASQYYFNLGAIMYNTGQMDESAKAFKKATEIDPKSANPYFWLGQALLGKATTGEGGKVIAAPGTKEAFETYLKLDPNGQNAATAQALLQTLEGGVATEFSKKKK